MGKKLNLERVRQLWFLLVGGIAGLVATVSLAVPSGVWVGNQEHDLPQGTKVCAEWEEADMENYFCSISPQYLGTGDWYACKSGFRHAH